MIGRVAPIKRILSLQAGGQLSKITVRNMVPQTSSNVVSGLPRNRIPFPEKVAAGLLMACLITTFPVWVLTHLNDYRTLEGDTE